MRPGADEAAGFRLQLGAVNAWRLLKQRCSPALGQLVPRSQTSGTRRQARSPRAPPPRGVPHSGASQSSHPPGEIRALHSLPKSQPLILLPGRLRGWGGGEGAGVGQRRIGRKEEICVGVTHKRSLGPFSIWGPGHPAPDTQSCRGTHPSSPEFLTRTHLPHELAFPVHTQVVFRLLALDPDLTTEGVCFH